MAIGRRWREEKIKKKTKHQVGESNGDDDDEEENKINRLLKPNKQQQCREKSRDDEKKSTFSTLYILAIHIRPHFISLFPPSLTWQILEMMTKQRF